MTKKLVGYTLVAIRTHPDFLSTDVDRAAVVLVVAIVLYDTTAFQT
jgi:hypothetical protein